jgi:recombinational DNA repair protein RecR
MTLQDKLRESADEVMAFPHPSQCDHLHSAYRLMREAADTIDRLQAENEALRKLAEHLRSCRDCGEWDVKDCSEGRPLWDAAMK